ncbi:hypothetical protein C8F01DRAFT_1368887 [Mycena amicta]|nr:hypothetical protein C8F01DRAFT_1368887 [Mycena amicta]
MLSLRRMPFRRQTFLQSQIRVTRSVSTVSNSTSTYPANNLKKIRCEQEAFAEPYRSKLNLRPFSCDWDSWSHYGFLDVNHGWYDLSEMEFFVRRVAKVPGTIRPLAFLDGVDPCIAFEADGQYYWLNTASSYLESFGGDFSSHDAFLLVLTKPPHIDGAFYRFPNDTDNLYSAVCREQKLRAAQAATLSTA